LHYLGHIEEKEATYHVRIYSVPLNGPVVRGADALPGQAFPNLTPTSMNAHAIYLGDLDPEPFDPSLLLSFDKIKLSAENEINIGIPRYDNIKLTFKADPSLLPMIPELKSGNPIWCEIVCEAKATDIPDLPTGAFLFPRKKRCIFWGKCVVQPSSGKVTNQKLQNEGGPNLAYANRQHLGTFDLTFKHWIQVIGAGPVRPWLDAFRLNFAGRDNVTGSTTVGWTCHVSELLYSLCSYITPTPLYAIADRDFISEFDNLLTSRCRGNVHLDTVISGGGFNGSHLYDLGWQVIKQNSPTLYGPCRKIPDSILSIRLRI